MLVDRQVKPVRGFEPVLSNGWFTGERTHACAESLRHMTEIRNGKKRKGDILIKCQCNRKGCTEMMWRSQSKVAWWRKSKDRLCEYCYNDILKKKGWA